MRHILFRFLLVVLCVFSFTLSFTGATLAQSETRTVRVGTYENPPKIYTDTNGRVTGLFGDILNYIALQENWELQYVPGSFEENLNRLENSEVDIIVDVAYSEERAALYDFTDETVLSSWGVVYTPSNSDIVSFKDLNNTTIAILQSSVYLNGPAGVMQYIDTFDLSVEFIEVAEYDEVFRLINEGEVDAGIVSRISGIKAETVYDNIKQTDIIFSPTELRFALTKENPNTPYLKEQIDFWMRELQNGHGDIYTQYLQKHNLFPATDSVEVTPTWVFPTLISVSIAIFILWILVLGLRRTRQIALRQLEEKERYLSTVVNNLPVILGEINPQGIITFAAGKALPKVIDDPKKLIGGSVFELYKDNASVVKNIKKALEGKQTRFTVTVLERVFSVVASPILSGELVEKIVVVAIDITDEYQLETAKKEFIALVQHQLRTPPGAMRWAIELLTPKVEKFLDESDKKIWQTFDQQTKRMITMAESLSLISEVESGLFKTHSEPIIMSELIEEIFQQFSIIISEKNLRIIKEFDQSLTVTQDKRALGIILQSLISNAVLYSDQDGVIEMNARESAGGFHFSISNTGEIIPEVERPKIFDRLFRGKYAIKINPEGLGIALYLTKIMVDELKGKIWYEVHENKNFFYVEFPNSKKT